MGSNKYCVIMAGGIGTRFWPKSRQSRPKQFLDILGTGKSFIRHTYERFAKMVPPENFLVVTNIKYKDLVLEHIPEITPQQVLCEPIGRNTAPCIAYAAYTLMKRDPGAKMIVTPSDHLILNEEDFRAIIGECLDFAARHDALMTVGIAVARGILLPMPGRVSATAFPLVIRAVLPLMHAPAFPDVGPAMSLAVPLMSRQFIRSLSTAIPIQLGFHVFFHEIAPFWNIFHIIVQEKPGWAYCLPAGAHSLSTSPGKAPAAWPLPKNRRGSDVRRHSAKAPTRWPP